MKPSELSRNLRTVAAKIDSSKKPDRNLVSRDLKRILAAIDMGTISFEMPGDQDWDPSFWDRIGEDPGFKQLTSALASVGAKIEDSEDITVTFPADKEMQVRKILADAAKGKYGADVKTYWSAATEI